VLLVAKLIVFAGVAFSIGALSSFAPYCVFQGFLADESLRSSIGDPGVVRALTGGLFLTMLGLLGLGMGAMTRSSTGAIAALFKPAVRAAGAARAPAAVLEDGYRRLRADECRHPDFLRASRSGRARTGFGVFSAYAVVALALDSS
jgi:ABC-2 type transport system permease protein